MVRASFTAVVFCAVSAFGAETYLTGSAFLENFCRERSVMMALEPDNLTWMHRVTGGLDSLGNTNGVRRLGGWEAPDIELRGHTVGHWLSGMANVIAERERCGGVAAEERRRVQVVLEDLKQVQEANKTGYVSAFPEAFIDRAIARKKVWAPWYTLHKLLAGLNDQYEKCGNRVSLEIARRFGDWAYNKVMPLSDFQKSQMLNNEFGGIGEEFYRLSKLTGDRKYDQVAKVFFHPKFMDPLTAREDRLAPWHCNTFIPKVLAEIRDWEQNGNEEARGRAEFFFETAVKHHMYAPGCFSDKEHFFKPDTQGAHLTGVTGESCCTYNMLKLANRLFVAEPRGWIADYIERALYNHILAQQEPMEGRVTYFMPVMTGSFKLRNRENDSFWCCVGSAMESQTGWHDYIVQEKGEDIYVNLFIPSVTKADGLTLVIETDFPKTPKATIRIGGNGTRRIFVRQPWWATVGKKESDYRLYERDWKEGDTIEVDLTCALHLEPTPDKPDLAAVFYGPWLLAGCLGTEGMKRDDTRSYNYYTHDFTVPKHLKNVKLGPLADIVPTEETFDKIDYPTEREIALPRSPVVFRNRDGLLLKPLYRVNGERWVVYWDIGK